MALQVYLRAIATGWWIVVITLIAGLGLATAYNSVSRPVYSSNVKFFVSTQSEEGETPLQADEFAQRRINSYVQLMTSEAMVEKVIDSSGVDLSVSQLTSMISAYSDPETVLLGVEVRDTDKERSFDIARAIADDFGGLVAELDNRGNADAANVKLNVVSGPTLTDKAVTPRTTLNLALGGIIGLALGVAVAILRKTSKKTVGTDGELHDVLGLPSVGFVPRLHNRRPADARDALALATERLVTNLGLDALPTPETRVIQVTSAGAGDGRTLVASSLASVLATLDRRVILVDADLRDPSLGQTFGLADGPGLTDVLSGHVLVDDAIRDSGMPLLSIIHSGSAARRPAELLTSRRFSTFIDELARDFDIVILDTPALLPHVDAAVIANKADGVLFVVNRDRTTRQQLRDAVATLSHRSPKLLGTVLNAAPAPSSRLSWLGIGRGVDKTVVLHDRAAVSPAEPAPPVTTDDAESPRDATAAKKTGSGRDKKVPVAKP
jgi:capsular exopolysaccharide synthesis family protein